MLVDLLVISQEGQYVLHILGGSVIFVEEIMHIVRITLVKPMVVQYALQAGESVMFVVGAMQLALIILVKLMGAQYVLLILVPYAIFVTKIMRIARMFLVKPMVVLMFLLPRIITMYIMPLVHTIIQAMYILAHVHLQ